jgi:peptide/nickel transport system substrate-binding protein
MADLPDTPTTSPNRARRARRLALLLALAAGVLAAGCGGSGGSTGAGSGGAKADTLVIANAVNVDTLDPAANSVNESIWMTQNIYQRLLQPNANGTDVIPQLAESWDISDDGLTYTFHLGDHKFSDGSPVTAEDVRYSIQRSINYDGGWGFLLEAVKSVEAPDPKTVVITLSRPHAPLLADLAMYAYAVIPEKLVKAQGAKAFFQKPIGSGEWMLTQWNKGADLTFKVNPFWSGKKPNFTTLKIMIVPNDNSRVLLLQNKNADIIENPPGNLINELSANPDLQTYLFPSTRVDFIQLDQHFAPFKDPKVREALNYAIDRNAIVKLAYSGHATVGSSFMPYKMQYWNDSLKPYPYDPEKAKQILSESSYPNGFKTYIIEVANDVAGNATAVVIKSDLAKIGIDVDIKTYELLTAYAKEDGGNSQMGQRYWTNDIIDPDEVTTFGVDPNGGANAFSSYWGDPTATKLVHQARGELDPDKRQQMYEQIQQIVYDQTPYLILDYSPYRYAAGKWVHGFHATPLGNYNLSLETLTVDQH